MATYRNASLTMHVFARDAVAAQRKAKRIVKKTGMQKVHAYSCIKLSTDGPSKYMVDVILKESITHRISKPVLRHAKKYSVFNGEN